MVLLTGWLWLDPAIALLVAGNILFTGWQLLRRSADGLLDAALPLAQRQQIDRVLDDFRAQGLDFDAIKTRQAGQHTFITLHVLVPGHWPVQQGHDCCENVEQVLRQNVPGAHIITHLEPLPASASTHSGL